MGLATDDVADVTWCRFNIHDGLHCLFRYGNSSPTYILISYSLDMFRFRLAFFCPSQSTESLAMIDHDLDWLPSRAIAAKIIQSLSLPGSLHGGFLNGGTTNWMINGKSQQEMDDLGGSPILGP